MCTRAGLRLANPNPARSELLRLSVHVTPVHRATVGNRFCAAALATRAISFSAPVRATASCVWVRANQFSGLELGRAAVGASVGPHRCWLTPRACERVIMQLV